MATSAAAWDLTGRSGSLSLPSGQKSGSSTQTGTGTQTITEQSSSVQAINRQNTPQFALDSLQDLIAQLSDRPALSDQEAAAQFPLAQRIWINDRVGWGYNIPGAGPISGMGADAQAKLFNEQQLAKRQQAQQASGIIRGGTAQQQEQNANLRTEVQANRERRAAYSKEAAFADATDLTARFQRQLLETLMPNINRAVEASGTSGGAVAGLLAQDAANRVAESQAALGLQTATQYGQIGNQISAILADLAKVQDPTVQNLLQALGIAKGTVDQGVISSSQSSTKQVQTQETKQGNTEETQAGSAVLAQLLGSLRAGASVSTPTTVSSSGPSVPVNQVDFAKQLDQIANERAFGGNYRF